MTYLRIGGKKITNFEKLTLTTRVDSIANALTFSTFLAFTPLEYQKVELVRNGSVVFTGNIVEWNSTESAAKKPNNYVCMSTSYILEDCTIPSVIYPLQTKDKTILEIVTDICDVYNVEVVSNGEKANKQLTEVDAKPSDKAGKFINKLCTEFGIIVSNDNLGRLVLMDDFKTTKKDYPTPYSRTVKTKGRGLYSSYIGIGQQDETNDTPVESLVFGTEYDSGRELTKIQGDGDNGNIEEFTFRMQADAKKSIVVTDKLTGYFPTLGDYTRIDGEDYTVNGFSWNLSAGKEEVTITRINKDIYDSK